MRDTGHCMMPYDKDDEFESFYDFARAYRELPQKPMIMAADQAEGENAAAEERKIERNQRMASKSNSSTSNKSNDTGEVAEIGADDESDDWEDIDCDDGEMEDVEEVASEDESEQPSEESKSSGFVVLTNKESEMSAGDKSGSKQTTSSFSVVDSRT